MRTLLHNTLTYTPKLNFYNIIFDIQVYAGVV